MHATAVARCLKFAHELQAVRLLLLLLLQYVSKQPLECLYVLATDRLSQCWRW
jgi:hypothetical protein